MSTLPGRSLVVNPSLTSEAIGTASIQAVNAADLFVVAGGC